MGQPEINAGIASVTGPWIMNLMLGMSRTIELTLTGRLMDAEEACRLGLIHHRWTPPRCCRALEVARELAAKPPVALRLNKQRFREMSQASFEDTMEAAIRLHKESYASGEPARMMEAFFQAGATPRRVATRQTERRRRAHARKPVESPYYTHGLSPCSSNSHTIAMNPITPTKKARGRPAADPDGKAGRARRARSTPPTRNPRCS